LSRLELSDQDFHAIANRCRTLHIDFLATPFGVGDVDLVESLGAPAIKIASPDIENLPLLRAAADTDLPILLSTGAATEAEITRAIHGLAERGASGRLILLHCVSCYPASTPQLNLGAISTLHSRFGYPTGFSDHSVATTAGALAVAGGACLLEKHFT